jgi:hypothetical protein
VKPRIDVHPQADRGTGEDEKIIAFRSAETGIGGLISFTERKGRLDVHVFRVDPDVLVTIEETE